MVKLLVSAGGPSLNPVSVYTEEADLSCPTFSSESSTAEEIAAFKRANSFSNSRASRMMVISPRKISSKVIVVSIVLFLLKLQLKKEKNNVWFKFIRFV